MISKEKKAEIIAAYGRTAEDTGSPEVQIALLTERIRELTDHLKDHPKDHHSCLLYTSTINESDVSLAAASNAIIIGFNVRVDSMAKSTADREHVDVRLYRCLLYTSGILAGGLG